MKITSGMDDLKKNTSNRPTVLELRYSRKDIKEQLSTATATATDTNDQLYRAPPDINCPGTMTHIIHRVVNGKRKLGFVVETPPIIMPDENCNLAGM